MHECISLFFLLFLSIIMELSASKTTMYLLYNKRKVLLTFPNDLRDWSRRLFRDLIRPKPSFTRSAAYWCRIYFRRAIFVLTIHLLTNAFNLLLLIVCLCTNTVDWFQSSMLRSYNVFLTSSTKQYILSFIVLFVSYTLAIYWFGCK